MFIPHRKPIVTAIFYCLILLSLYINPFPTSAQVKTGIDVLIENNFSILKNKNVALLTNHAGRTNKGELSASILSKQKSFQLVSILVPEHGFYISVPAGSKVKDRTLFGVPVYSLYGIERSPGKKILSGCDVILIDIQDIGVRSYTYISTVYKVMEAAAKFSIPVIILDRPNPLGGMIVDGNTIDKGRESFVGIVPISYIHGLTIGELAQMINQEGWLPIGKNKKPLKCDLSIIEMKGWSRWMAWEDTGMLWFPTSPHVPTVNAIRGLGVLGIFGELGIINIGIGTTLPFQYIGMPNFKVKKVIEALRRQNITGMYLDRTKFKPFYAMYGGKYCDGFLLRFPLSNDLRPYTNGIKIFLAIRKVYPNIFEPVRKKNKSRAMFIKVTGTKSILNGFLERKSDKEILRRAEKGLLQFTKKRVQYLIYK